jgi:hypothetical protein
MRFHDYNILSEQFHVYRTIILPVVLYGCETCPLILREEHKRGVFRIFGLKRNALTEGWRKPRSEELHV